MCEKVGLAERFCKIGTRQGGHWARKVGGDHSGAGASRAGPVQAGGVSSVLGLTQVLLQSSGKNSFHVFCSFFAQEGFLVDSRIQCVYTLNMKRGEA